MSLFIFISDINEYFEVLTPSHLFSLPPFLPFIKFSKDLRPVIYFDPSLFFKHLRLESSADYIWTKFPFVDDAV